MADLSDVELLSGEHDVSEFDCGTHPSLNEWLRRHALQSQSGGSARTYVVHREQRVVAYYAISAGSASRSTVPVRVAQGHPNPVPIGLLARLAVDKSEQGTGLGSSMLKDALLKIDTACEVLGIRAVLVHAIDDAARSFYERFDFKPCPEDELHLTLLMKDLRNRLRRG